MFLNGSHHSSVSSSVDGLEGVEDMTLEFP